MFEQVAVSQHRSVLGDWLIRAGIALAFIFFGTQKFSPDASSEWIKIVQQIGFGDWFRYFTAVVEVSGGVMVLIPWTVTAGLALLACTMLGALLHLSRRVLIALIEPARLIRHLHIAP